MLYLPYFLFNHLQSLRQFSLLLMFTIRDHFSSQAVILFPYSYYLFLSAPPFPFSSTSTTQLLRPLGKGRKRRKQPSGENLCAGGRQGHNHCFASLLYLFTLNLGLYCIVFGDQQTQFESALVSG